jgi:hypothetical protein
MTKDDIIRMALDSYGAMTETGSIQFKLDGSLVRFAALLEAKVRADEREACAKECEAEAQGRSPSLFDALCDCADAIRARGKQ